MLDTRKIKTSWLPYATAGNKKRLIALTCIVVYAHSPVTPSNSIVSVIESIGFCHRLKFSDLLLAKVFLPSIEFKDLACRI